MFLEKKQKFLLEKWKDGGDGGMGRTLKNGHWSFVIGHWGRLVVAGCMGAWGVGDGWIALLGEAA